MDQCERTRRWLAEQQRLRDLEQQHQLTETKILLSASGILVFVVCMALWYLP